MLDTMLASHSQSAEPFLAPVPALATFAQDITHSPTRVVEKKEHVYHEADPATHVFKVEAGYVCVYRTLSNGRRQIIDFAFPGDFVGLGECGEYTTNAQATERTRLRCLPVSALQQLVRDDPELGLALYQALSCELLACREHLVSVGQKTASERLAAFLIALSRRNERRGEDATDIVLPMMRTDIADFLGLTHETVSRTFSKFRANGLIDLEQCILVKIRDISALCEVAEGGGA